jgi:hypothetical protein
MAVIRQDTLAVPINQFLVGVSQLCLRAYLSNNEEFDLFDFRNFGLISAAKLVENSIVVVVGSNIIFIDTVGGPTAPRQISPRRIEVS